jgi:hypothetical protein
MAVDERARHQLHGKLDEALGPEEAAILMEHLPPVGWADVATKRDLDALGASVNHRIGSLELRIDTFEERLRASIEGVRAEFYRQQSAQTRTLMVAMLSMFVLIAGVAFGAARLV